MRRFWGGPARALILVLALPLAGCGNLGYYLQAAEGHLALLARARPVEAVLTDPATPVELKRKLEAAQAARDFASRKLALPDNGSYRRYADLGRAAAVWNVFATPELALRLKEWCFPVVGCVAYRGYYAQGDAEAFAAALRAEGYDTFVSAVPAYSTLGWFDDPLLSTFLGFPDAEVARLIFHELAHQRVYARDDSLFNESFATAVEIEGMRRWLALRGTDEDRARQAEAQRRKAQFVALMLEYRARLEAAYASPLADAGKRAAKQGLLAALREDYAALKREWGGHGGYDRWFGADLGNAQLASVATYTKLVPAFQALLAAAGGELPAFYAAAERLARLTREERHAELTRLAPEAGR